MKFGYAYASFSLSTLALGFFRYGHAARVWPRKPAIPLGEGFGAGRNSSSHPYGDPSGGGRGDGLGAEAPPSADTATTLTLLITGA